MHIQPGIEQLKPYVPGKPIEELRRELGLTKIVKLASNESPYGPSPKVIQTLQALLPELNRYPDGSAVELRAALAKHHQLQPEQILIGNGSNELIELAIRTFSQPGDVIVSGAITFSVYHLVAMAHGVKFETAAMKGLHFDLTALAELACKANAAIVFVANPNNPTGTAFSQVEFERFLAAVPRTTVVVYDAAYAEYGLARGIPDGLSQLPIYPNLLVTRTFSKAYGLAGLRVGWGAGTPKMIDYMNRVRQPFNVNRLALAAAQAALQDQAYMHYIIEMNARGISYLRQGLAKLGFESDDSYANFVLFETPIPADDFFVKLLHKGVIVRSMSGFGLPKHLRVNTGTPEENDFFLQQLSLVLAEL